MVRKRKKKVELVQRKNLNPFADFITIKKAEVKKEEYVSNFFERNEPKNLLEVVGNNTSIISLKKWFRSVIEGEEVPPFCYIFGEHGVGKTVSVKLMFKSFDYEIVEYNETTGLDKKKIVEQIEKVSQNNGLNKLFETSKKKGIVIDCVEKVLGESDKNLKKIMNCKKLPIILISNQKTINSKNVFKKYSHCVRYRNPWPNELKELSKRIIKNENIKITKKSTEYIIKKCKGDVRYFLNIMKMSKVNNNKKIKIKETKKIIAFMERDNFFETKEVIHNIFNKNCKLKVNDIYKQCESDTLLLTFSLQENYPKFYNFEDVCEIADSISEGDIFRSYMFNNQCWEMYNYTVNSNFYFPNLCSNKSKWTENSKLKQSQYITSRWPIVNNENKKKEWFDRTFVKLSVNEISMFVHKILIPQLIVKKEISLEIIEKCKHLRLDYVSIIKFYTISLKKIKNLTKKTKEKLKNIFQE
jgi:DNA polymerase III delta prime subunit